MTKQEEIREGMLNIFGRAGVVKFKDMTFIDAAVMDEIMVFLHKSGVVIKVGEISDDLASTTSESPKYFVRGKDMALLSSERTADIFKQFKDMGLAVVESLIKEE